MSKLGNGGEPTSTAADAAIPHVALFPTSGAGHLIPFLRLAATLTRRRCKVTLITTHPSVSTAETRLISRFLAAFPQVTEKDFTLLPLAPGTVNTTDPFFLRWEAMSRSAHLLSSILSSLSPPLSVLISDTTVISSTIPVTLELKVPNFVLFTSSVRMFALFSNFPLICETNSASYRLNSSIELSRSSLPPLLLDPDAQFTKLFKQNGLAMKNADGALINSFEGLETEALKHQPRSVFGVGPFPPEEFEKDASEGSVTAIEWLEKQSAGSVVYVSFGSRNAMGTEQIRELASGLVMSGSKFLWVLKTTVVDKEDEASIEEILGSELLDKIRKPDRGLVVKGWVDQATILGYKAVGGFLSHCGWNSVTEAALNGVPIVAWPLFGDQRINAEVVEGGGWGRILKGWRWEKDVVVKAEDIAETVKMVMESEGLKSAAMAVGEAARKAIGGGGCSDANWSEICNIWK